MFFYSNSAFSQFEINNKVSARGGISLNIGTHIIKIGVSGQVFGVWEVVQTNVSGGVFYNLKMLGTRKKGWEGVIKTGILGVFGKKRERISDFFHELSNRSNRKNSIGYSYNWYFDKIGTSQCTGSIGFQFGRWDFIQENDFFAFKLEDKFRTGGVALYFSNKNYRFGWNTFNYTGDPYSPNVPIIFPKNFKTNFGCVDMSKAPYGEISVGVSSLVFERSYGNGQVASFNIGVDAEQIRNTIQNKWIHDSKWMPNNWDKTKNPHIPMLDTQNRPFLYNKGQKIRKPKLFFQVGNNLGLFY